jgi:hypothetical protein
MNFNRSKWPALLIGLLWCGAVHAQTNLPGRWLLVFDTSPAMKTRLPGTIAAVKQFLATSADGEIREGDSVAVWSYDKTLQRGQNSFVWNGTNAAASVTNLPAWLKRLAFLNESSLSALNPSLARVVSGSERLTIVIFCDGQSPVTFTPYDDGINQNFRDSLAERKKSRQPFVIVLRGQQGRYVGCTVNLPPAGISLPPFPPLPPPPKPVVVTPSKPGPVTPPVVTTPALVITGTKVGTNLNAEPEPALPRPVPPTNPMPPVVAPAPTNPPAVPAPVKAEPSQPPTNTVKPVIAPSTPTNPPATVIVTQVVVKTIAPAVAPTNSAPATPTPESKPQPTKFWLFTGAAVLLVTVILAAVFLRRSGRRSQSSLISTSMEDDSRRK